MKIGAPDAIGLKLYSRVFDTLKTAGLLAAIHVENPIITVSMLRQAAHIEMPGLLEHRVPYLYSYFLRYAEANGQHAPDTGKTKITLQNALEKAKPWQKIESVFDRALAQIEPPAIAAADLPSAPTWLPPAYRVHPIDAYEAMRIKFGWDSDAKIKIENALRATQTKPPASLFDWMDGAFKRYFVALSKTETESINSEDGIEKFLDKFILSSQCSQPQRRPENDKIEAVNVCHAHVPLHTCTRFVETVYDPSIQFDADLHMRTSFTNRLKAVDWTYHLQMD
jgi:hypothetical protein